MVLSYTSEVNQNFKDRMFWWWAKVKTNKDYWVRFTLCWIIFDAYLTEISDSGRDDLKLKYFYKNENDFKKCIQKSWLSLLSSHINALKNLSPIEDMRPNLAKKVCLKVCLNDIENIEEVFNFIYQIRCNLFHGSKDIKNSKDAELVRHAEKFLHSAIGAWMDGPTEFQ